MGEFKGSTRLDNNGPALLKVLAAQKQADDERAVLSREMRRTASDIFVGLLLPYLQNTPMEAERHADPAVIKRLAEVSVKCAPHLYRAFGFKMKDEEEKPNG